MLPWASICAGATIRGFCRLAVSTSLLMLSAAVPASTVRAQAEEARPPLTPAEIRQYEKAQTLIDWTPKQIRAHPELRELQLVESQQDLPPILREVGKRVAVFFEDFPNTTSTEGGPVGALRE